MALLLPNSVFYHNPKCGGTWVREAIKRAEIPYDEITADHPDMMYQSRGFFHHLKPYEINRKDIFTFTFIRHPLTWLQSYWKHRILTGWDNDNPWDFKFRSPFFEDYVSMYLKLIPGKISEEFKEFCNVDFVGKQENLVDDLIKALRLAGEVFDEDKIKSTPKANVSKKEIKAIYPDNLKAQMIEAESKIIKKYYSSKV